MTDGKKSSRIDDACKRTLDVKLMNCTALQFLICYLQAKAKSFLYGRKISYPLSQLQKAAMDRMLWFQRRNL